MSMSLPLSPLQSRVLGVLIEKAHTVPDSYPLSLNSLTLGCNQKTARTPVLNATEAEVQSAVDALKALHLAFEASGSRVTRYEHNLGRALGLPSQSVGLLATLLLRGPLTASELRAASERLHRFADLSSVEAFLEELASRAQEKGGALVVKLPRAPGARESRWAHLLGGPVDVASFATERRSAGVGSTWVDAVDVVGAPLSGSDRRLSHAEELAACAAGMSAMRSELADLRALVERLYTELGVPRP